MDWNNIQDAQRAITQWADKQFPNRKPEHTLMKLVLQEVGEYYSNPGSPGEFADMLILLFDLASMHDINIAKALEDKMMVNVRRHWVMDPKTGLAQHVERIEDWADET